jgi:hypothetical protein
MGRNHADSIKKIEKYAEKFGLNEPNLSSKITLMNHNRLIEMILQHLVMNIQFKEKPISE